MLLLHVTRGEYRDFSRRIKICLRELRGIFLNMKKKRKTHNGEVDERNVGNTVVVPVVSVVRNKNENVTA